MITVIDQAGALSGSDVRALQSVKSVFDVQVLVTTKDTRPGLELHVHDLVTTANTVAIGVDPEHHYTYAHFGTGTGVPRMEFTSIARAGNGEFRSGHMTDGIRAIITAANAASVQTQHASVVIQQPMQVVEKSTPVWPFVLGFGIIVVVGVLIMRKIRRKQQDVIDAAAEAQSEANKLYMRNAEEQRWHDQMAKKVTAPTPSLPPPSGYQAVSGASVQRPSCVPSPQVIVRDPAPYYPMAPVIIGTPGLNSGNDLLTGMLIGEAMNSRPVVEERVVERVVETSRHEPAPTYSDSDSGSSWSDSSSNDSGGGGSDWGGGSDSGGSDGGGSGGDW